MLLQISDHVWYMPREEEHYRPALGYVCCGNSSMVIDTGNSPEHISDMCSDLAIYILQLSDPEVIGNEHDYIHELHHSGNQEYQDAYKVHYSKYFGALNDLPFTKDGSPKDSPEQLSFT